MIHGGTSPRLINVDSLLWWWQVVTSFLILCLVSRSQKMVSNGLFVNPKQLKQCRAHGGSHQIDVKYIWIILLWIFRLAEREKISMSWHPRLYLLWFAVQMGVRAKLLQLWLTLCDPMDCSPPGSSIQRILQARTLEWVAISSYRWSPCRPRDQTGSLALQADSLPSEPTGKPWEWRNGWEMKGVWLQQRKCQGAVDTNEGTDHHGWILMVKPAPQWVQVWSRHSWEHNHHQLI